MKEESLLYFREKAVGENLKEFEHKIAEEIHKKYLSVKSKCLSIYETKCSESVNKDIEHLESAIR